MKQTFNQKNVVSVFKLTEKIRSVEEINNKIRKGDAFIVTADEMVRFIEEKGVEAAASEVDVVTTGTFGAMCSSGAVINLGHADPPIKIQTAWMNDVKVSHPGAAVDLYIGATHMSETRPFEYGGGHVIEDLIRGSEIELRATAYGTDCYPRTRVQTTVTKEDLNQFVLLNFRNGYQRYACATNSRDEIIYTYMGKLLPRFQNATFSGSGCLNPLMKDPSYETIGIGTRIFLGGAQGYVIGEGTQHNPRNNFGTIMVKGDCKKMSSDFIRGASFTKYGTTLYVGIGIPIPILNRELAVMTGVGDDRIFTDIVLQFAMFVRAAGARILVLSPTRIKRKRSWVMGYRLRNHVLLDRQNTLAHDLLPRTQHLGFRSS